MEIPFIKYSGSGNDFIIIDNRNESFHLSREQIAFFCKRREGIGADGVVYLNKSKKGNDFSFRIWNADGSEAEMCGNASRSIVHYAYYYLKLKADKHFVFDTMNGVYEGEVIDEESSSEIKIKMTELYDLDAIDISDLATDSSLYLNTGVPHAVLQVSDVSRINISNVGRAIRNDKRFSNEGTNVDFFQVLDESAQRIRLRVYERGVEAETLCCGTGIMATAITCAKRLGWSGRIIVDAEGGQLSAIVDKELKELYFQGPVKAIYKGVIICE